MMIMKKNQAFTIVELVIVMLVSLVVLGAVYNV